MTRHYYLPTPAAAMERELDRAWRGDLTEAGRALKDAGAAHRRAWAESIVGQGNGERDGEGETR